MPTLKTGTYSCRLAFNLLNSDIKRHFSMKRLSHAGGTGLFIVIPYIGQNGRIIRNGIGFNELDIEKSLLFQ
jgi:hypothetical protein